MYIHTSQIRVRYGETDRMGYLYYGFYAWYYEVGRVEAIRQLGISYRELEDQGVLLPVVEWHIQYFKPAYYDDLITVKTILKDWPIRSAIRFHTELYNEQGELLNKGITTLVFVDAQTRKKTVIPQILREKLEPYFIPAT
ncbi:MAG: acyl-CoA thioesterase [Thermoflavifilum sp.]|nr:acyl-CoA thioesterase [Thermoflavifilum sp.]